MDLNFNFSKNFSSPIDFLSPSGNLEISRPFAVEPISLRHVFLDQRDIVKPKQSGDGGDERLTFEFPNGSKVAEPQKCIFLAHPTKLVIKELRSEILMLRREYAHYSYRDHTDLGMTQKLTAFIRNSDDANFMTRTLASHANPAIDAWEMDIGEAFDLAEKHLSSSFNFIGVEEQFLESVYIMLLGMGVESFDCNSGRFCKMADSDWALFERLPLELQDRLAEISAADRQLYADTQYNLEYLMEEIHSSDELANHFLKFFATAREQQLDQFTQLNSCNNCDALKARLEASQNSYTELLRQNLILSGIKID